MQTKSTDNPLYTDSRYNDKIRYNDNFTVTKPSLKQSNRYPKHMFCEGIRTKQYISYISFCPLTIFYNSKFIIMAATYGTNSVVVRRAHCIYQPQREKIYLLTRAPSEDSDQTVRMLGAYARRQKR